MESLLPQTKRILGMHVALFLVSVSVWAGMFYMIEHKIEEAKVIEGQITEEKSYEDRNRSLKVLLDDSNGDITRLNSRYVGASSTVDFLESIETYGKLSGAFATVDTVQEGEYKENPEAFKTLSLAISATGSWQQVYHFLSLLENMPYKVSMPNVVLAGGTQWKVSTTITVIQKK